MPDPKPPVAAAPPKQFGKGKLIALVGAACAGVLVPTVQQWEGRELVPYQDIVGIWTDCDGNTYDVVPGRVRTNAECDVILEKQLVAHAAPVLKCVPELGDKPNALAASVSLAYNIGPARFCSSTAAKRFRVHQWRLGCEAFLPWNKAGGRVVKGLDRRRKAERAICLRDAA